LSLPRTNRKTVRLTLEPVATTRAEELWNATAGSLPELRPWMAWAADSSATETRNFAARAETQWASGEAYHFTLLRDGEVAGGISVEVRQPLERIGELGYWVRTDLCGRGLATEAGVSMVDFGFGVVGLHRLELRAGTGNRASQRVAEKLGFRREGMLREASRGAYAPYDSYVYGLLASDPRPSAEAFGSGAV
jgi:RimJ/RimL family protein N-acetyltransferase